MQQKLIWASVLSLALAGTAAAQTKMSGTLSCADPESPYSIEVGDSADHVLGLAKFSCTWTKSIEIDGVSAKEAYDVVSSDVKGTKSRDTGTHVSTMANGDQIFVHFSGVRTATKDGKPLSNVGSWRFAGGTGKFKGITGKGTYNGKPDASGKDSTDIEGEYTLPAK